MPRVVLRVSTSSTMLGGFALLLLCIAGFLAITTHGRPNSDTAHLGHLIGTPPFHDDSPTTQGHIRSTTTNRSRQLQETGSDNFIFKFFLDLVGYLIDLLSKMFGLFVEQKSATCPTLSNPPPLPGKKGIGFTMRADGENGSATENLPKAKALSVRWNYSWGRDRPDGQPDGVEFVPMIWGAYENKIAEQVRQVRADFEAGLTKRLLGYNEPDKVDQSNVPVERAVALWKTLEESGMPLVSPSPANPVGPWMQDFMNRTESSCLRMEWLGVHWYGGASVQAFKTRMLDIYNMYGGQRPLLLTEFAPADWNTGGDPTRNRWTEKMVLDFAKEALPWLEQQDFIAGYAWFPFDKTSPQGHTSALFELDGQLTPLGKYYASVTPENIYGDQSIVVEFSSNSSNNNKQDNIFTLSSGGGTLP